MAAMKLSSIRYIYEARLEARAVLVQEGFAILGIAVGVALLFSSQVSSTSLAASEAQLNRQLVGSAQVQIDARGPEGFSQRLLGEVRSLSGVQVALPIVERQVSVIGPGGERSVVLIGVQPYSVQASGPLLRRFSAAQIAQLPAIALPAPLAGEIGAGPLAPVKLQVGVRFVDTLVGATLGAGDIGGLVHSPVAVTSIGYARRLVGSRGEISRIFVRYYPARASEARAALARLAARWNVNLVPGDMDARLFAVAVAPESESETLFSAISALVGFMFALNAMLVTVPSRRKLIKDMRPHGATLSMIVQILLLDAAVIGVLACVLGLILGDVLSIAVFHTTPDYLAFAFPVGDIRVVSWQSVAVAILAGMTAAVVGVLWPVRDILSRSLQRAPDSAHHRRAWIATRLAVGLLSLAITTVILVADTRAAVVGNIALVLALLCLLPFLFDGLLSAYEQLAEILNGVASAFAVTELQTPQIRVRSLAIAATAALAVFGVVEFQGVGANLKRGLQSSLRGTDSSTDIWVIPSGKSSLQPTTPFKAIDTAALARLPGVSRIGVYRGSFLDWGDRRLWVIGPADDVERPVPVDQLISGDPRLASERVRGGGWAVLSQGLASEHHLHVGQTFTLPSPRPLTLRVAALTTNLGWPPGAIILSSSTYARAWASTDPSAYEIQIAAGASVASVRDLIRNSLRADRGLAVETSAERERRHYAVASQALSRLTQIRVLVMITATLAVVIAMAAMIRQRRERIAKLKSEGYSELVLWRWLLCEAAILLTAGSSIGAIFGLYAQLLGSHFLASVTGFPIIFNIEAVAALTSFGLVSVAAVLMLVIPGYLAVRVPPSTVSSAY
jgi:putative ABC transport system permease protein